MSEREEIAQAGKALTEAAICSGNVIHIGWLAFKTVMLGAEGSAIGIDTVRLAYLSGAEHVFKSMLAIMESGSEDADLDKMEMIEAEVAKIREEIQAVVRGKQ